MSKFNDSLKSKITKPLQEELEEKLDSESLADFYKALENKNISAPMLVETLEEFGVKTSVSTIHRWRNGESEPTNARRKASNEQVQ